MNEITRCLREIDKVKRVAAGVEVAYVARSRLGRLILSVTRLVCNRLDIETPDRPVRLSVPDTANQELQMLVDVCNRLNETVKTISQPSEPLDQRWRSGWSVLLEEVAELEGQLQLMHGGNRTTYRPK